MKNILITGATGLLGLKLVQNFSEHNLIITDKSEISLQKLLDSFDKSIQQNITTVAIDLADENQLHLLVEEVFNKFTTLDILINNAALTGSSSEPNYVADFQNQDINSFRKALNVNLIAPFYLSQKLFDKMVTSKNPKIINIASIYGLVTSRPSLYTNTLMESPVAYETSKAALIQLTKYLAARFAPKILVNAVAPGGISRNQDSNFIGRYLENVPLKRMANVEDIVNWVTWLASDDASYVTGQILSIDGGLNIW
jgi:NAD(P)-dependent dehydrogenase (short-subunit alcohol dehydrogenase family)